MSFVARAYKSHERGDTLRAVFILITGLRRDPYDEEGLDALIDLYSMNASLTGLEHEIIEVLVKRDDCDDILSVLVDNLRSNGNQTSAEKLLLLGGEGGIEYIPQPEDPAPPLEIQEQVSSPKPEKRIETEPPKRNPLEDIPPEIDYEPEAETVDIEREEFHEEEPPDTKKSSNKLLVLFLGLIISVAIGAFYFNSQDKSCQNCSEFDSLILSWPESTAELKSIEEVHEEMAERKLFLGLLEETKNSPPQITSPKTWYGIAFNGIIKKQLCASREPAHIAISWCRISYFDQQDDNEKLEKSTTFLRATFPLFNRKQEGEKPRQLYAADDPMRPVFHAFFTDFHGAKDSALIRDIGRFPEQIEDFPEHETKKIIDALNALSKNDNKTADKLLLEFLERDIPPRLVALIQAIFPRAFLYNGDTRLAAKYSAPLGGVTIEGDRDRPRSLKLNPISIISESWEAEEAIFSRIELLSELNHPKLALTILGQIRDLGNAYERTQEREELIGCIFFSECKESQSPKGKTLARWLASDVEVEIENAPWTGFLRGIPGSTLDYKPSGALNRWWYSRIKLVASAQHGKANSEWKTLYSNFQSAGLSADLARGLSKFWQGDYSGSIRILAQVNLPISLGFSGLSNRALGESILGNKQLKDAGLRFDKKGGADFELGILNERIGQKERANNYYWSAWTQDWSRENALIKWCQTLPPRSFSIVNSRLKDIEGMSLKPEKRSRILAIREICLSKMSQSQRLKAIDLDSAPQLPYWIFSTHAEAAFQKKSYSRARVLFKKALEANPSDPTILHGAARCAHVDKDIKRAKELANRYLSLWPNGPHRDWARGVQNQP